MDWTNIYSGADTPMFSNSQSSQGLLTDILANANLPAASAGNPSSYNYAPLLDTLINSNLSSSPWLSGAGSGGADRTAPADYYNPPSSAWDVRKPETFGGGASLPRQDTSTIPETSWAGDMWGKITAPDAQGRTNLEKWVIPGVTGGVALISQYNQAKRAEQQRAALQAQLNAERAAAMERQRRAGQFTSLADTVAGMQPTQTPVANIDALLAAAATPQYGHAAGPKEQRYYTNTGMSIVPKAVADGGSIHGYAMGGMAEGSACPHCGGLGKYSHYVQGGTSGQADKIPAMLSDGEYVFDADTVAALGDGNNNAGAKKLDMMRQSVRAHKRAAPASKIPPKAKEPMAYLKGK